MVDHQWRDIEQRYTVRDRGIDLLLMQIQSNAARPTGLQEPDQLCEGPSDPAQRPNQHLIDRTAADRLDQRLFTRTAILSLPNGCRPV